MSDTGFVDQRPAGPRIDPRWGVALVALLALATVFWPRATKEPPSEGGFLIDDGGRPVPISRELKPVTLVHFWATWCPPCLEELPRLMQFAESVEDDRFGLLLVAVRDEAVEAKRFLGSDRYPLLFDPQWEVAHRFSTSKLPETHLLVRGEVVDSFIAAQDWRRPEIRERVLAHLTPRAPAAAGGG